MKDKNALKESIEKIFSSSDTLPDIIFGDDTGHITREPAAGGDSSPGNGAGMGRPELLNKLGLIKQYHEGGSKCKVTFKLLRESSRDIRNVTIVGDFNNWDSSKSPMLRLDNGDFVITLDLESKREYRFRYLVNGNQWENDLYADKYVRNWLGSKDSVVVV